MFTRLDTKRQRDRWTDTARWRSPRLSVAPHKTISSLKSHFDLKNQ